MASLSELPTTIAERLIVRDTGCWEWTAAKYTQGYGCIWLDGRSKRVHRVVWELTIGAIPEGLFIDHICSNRICANPAHLRVVTAKQNAEHKLPLPNNKTGARGVTWDSRRGRWKAQVQHNGRTRFIGRFYTKEEAAMAALQARNDLFTHNNETTAA